MAKYSPEELGEILANADLSWFTVALKGEIKRYAVAFTDNIDPSLELLAGQANFFDPYCESLTIWWRRHPDGSDRIDIWTSFDDLKQALHIGSLFKQHSIRDFQIGKWIELD